MLGEKHDLQIQMAGPESIEINLALLPPEQDSEPVNLRRTAAIPPAYQKADVAEWLRIERAKGRTCACGCGREIDILPRHHSMGIPEYRSECRHKAMAAKRARAAGGKYINAAQLAKKLGVSQSTISRWVRKGKLPKPKRVSGMKLFEKDRL
jgi:hypothetical protein